MELAGLFQMNAAALKGRSPVGREHVTEAAEVGSTLLAVLWPIGTRRRKSADGEAADAARDRDTLASLLVREHDRLRRAGAWLFGGEVDRLVPPLGSRPLVRKRATEKPATPTA